MRIVLPFFGVAAAVVIAATSCTALPALGTGCGNKVIDDGEDCDGNYDSSSAKCIAPGQPSACHFSCVDTACPAPFTCGEIDHVCRRPAGTFGNSATIAGEPARRVLVGDFDGDGAEDVVAVGLSSRVHYFDGKSSTQQTLLSSDAALPALGHVTTDGRASGLVTSTYFLTDSNNQTVRQGSVRVWRGSPDRTLLPTVYPNIDFPPAVTGAHAVSVLRGNQLGSDVFALLTINGVTSLYYVNGTEQTQTGLPEPAANPAIPLGDPAKIHGRVPVGTLGDTTCAALTPFNVCQAIVLAFEGDKTVSIHSSCDKTGASVNVYGGGAFQPPITLTLPNNDSVLGPAFLFGATSTDAPTLYVVGSFGTYAFAPDATKCSVTAPSGPLVRPPPTPPPLALGYIADLTHLAWVDAKGVHVDTGANNVITTSAPTSTTWNDAIIGDMNLNGLPDVVAVADGSIDFYNGTGSVLLNGKHITLDGTATHMAIGDFDGDFVSDIAVSTHGDSTGLSSDSIDVAFGTFTGFPSQPVSIGRLSSLLQLEPSYFDYRIAGSPDLIGTLFAAGKSDTGDIVVSILQGNPDRLINSPFFLFDPATANASLVATTVADFESSNGHEGMAGLSATKTGIGLWYTPMTGDAQVDPSKEIFGELSSGVTLDGTVASLATIDVGGEPGKELLVVEPGNFFLTHVVANQTIGPWPSLAYEKVSNVLPIVDEKGNVTKGIVTRVTDADGDGDDDVIVECFDAAKTFTAKIILNGMNGTLSFNDASAIALPAGTVAVTTIHAKNDGSTQIAALSAKGVFLAQMTNGVLGAWSVDPVIDLSKLAQLSTPVSVHDMIAGDVDGDGVDDVVIATSSGFIVYFGDPA